MAIKLVNATVTAQELYDKEHDHVLATISLIKAGLTLHKEMFRRSDSDWSFVGDLNHVNKLLEGINDYLHGIEE